jgi:HlyD family secretion protein
MPVKMRTILFATSFPALAVTAVMPWPEHLDWRPFAQKVIAETLAETLAVKPPAPDYTTSVVSRGDIRKEATGTGVVRPLVSVLVGSQVSGQIVEIKASFNSFVKSGDILAILDDKMFASRIAQAEADLAVAEAMILVQQAGLDKAEATKRLAELDFERQRALMKTKTTTQSQLEAAEQSVAAGKADVTAAKAQVASATASVQHRQAELTQARIDFGRTQIRAPIDGVVLSRMVEVGQTVAASLQAPELFRIAKDLRNVQIEAQISEADIAGVQQGNAVAFTVDAYPERTFQGHVTEVRLAPVIEQNLVTYTVVVEADNADLKLFPGMTASVRIETARHAEALRVPAEALRYRPANAPAEATVADAGRVWVQQPSGQIEARAVRIGMSDGGLVEIFGDGLAPGARVLVRRPARANP